MSQRFAATKREWGRRECKPEGEGQVRTDIVLFPGSRIPEQAARPVRYGATPQHSVFTAGGGLRTSNEIRRRVLWKETGGFVAGGKWVRRLGGGGGLIGRNNTGKYGKSQG
jgi:hypothetical protein